MKKLLAIALLVISCSEQPKIISSVPFDPENAPVIGYYQSVQSNFIPGESKTCYSSVIDILVTDEYFQNRDKRQKDFASNISDNCQAVFLSKVKNNNCIPDDVCAAHSQREIQSYPFVFKATSYNGDSSSLYIVNPVKSSEYLDLKLNGKLYRINAGNTLTVIDTLMTRTDPDHCWEQLIITKQITNFGQIPLTDDKLTTFF